MTSLLEEQTFENAMNNFIDNNLNDKLLVDLENPVCRLVTPGSKLDSPTSDKSLNTANLLSNIKSALKDGSDFAKNVGSENRYRSISSRSSVEGNSTDKNEVLQHAEAVIEYQRERINILEKTLEKFNVAMTKTNELHKDELDRYEKENKDMRLQMQNVISDYDAITKRYQVDMSEFEALKGKSLKTDSELIKKDEQIKEMSKKLELLPKENELLKMQKNDLLEEVRVLKNELFPKVKAWERPYDSTSKEDVPSLYNLPPKSVFVAQSRPHVLCDVRKQETAAMGRCLMQVENDLSSYKRLSEDQRIEIQRLNNLLQVKNKTEQFENNLYFGSHKQLMYLRDVFVSMVKSSNQLAENMKVKKDEPVQQEDRSLHAAYVLKSNSEQREMYDKLLDVVKNVITVKSSTTSFYRCKVDYCKLSELNQLDLDLKFNKMLVEVEDSKVLVHQLEDDQIVYTETITQENLKAVRSDYKNLQFILKDDYYHLFRFDNSDGYNRLYYGLQYAGFLMDDSKLSIYSKVDLTYLNTEENWPQDLVPVLFSKVLTLLNDNQNPGSPSNMGNRSNFVVGYPFNTNLMANYYNYYNTNNMNMNNVSGQLSPTNVGNKLNMGYLVDNLFENVNVLSEFTSSLLYYDKNSRSLVIYGPNLANKPKVLKLDNTYKFKVTNSLDYSSEQTNASNLNNTDDQRYVDSYQVPFATFPNGEPVLDYFNPQLTNYSLVTVKYTYPDGINNYNNELNDKFNQLVVSDKVGQNYNNTNSNFNTSPNRYPNTNTSPNMNMNYNTGAYNSHNNVNNRTKQGVYNQNVHHGVNQNPGSPMFNAMDNMVNYELEFDVYYLLPLNPKYNEMLTKLMEKMQFLRLKSTKVQEVLQEHKLEVTDDEKFYSFVDGNLQMNLGSATEEPIKIPCNTGHYRVNEANSEITLMSNLDTDKMESFSLMITNKELLKQFLTDLNKNGFKLLRGEVQNSTGQTCIVTEGYIQIFDTNEQIAAPIVVFQKDNTEVEVDEKVRTITIVLKTDKLFKMNLDCLNPDVFSRWKNALRLAGFLEPVEKDSKIDEMPKLKEIKFDVKIFDDETDENRAIRVTNDKICLYVTPSSKNPLHMWEKTNINLELIPDQRRLIVYLYKKKRYEEKFDLQVRLLTDYQNVTNMLEKCGYKMDDPKKIHLLKHYYILSRPGVISLHRTNHDKDPLISMGIKSYEVIVKTDTLTIKFKPKIKSKSPITLTFRSEPTFKKFLFSLKVANFVPFTKDKIPMHYFPKIIYGFACDEAKKLFKDYRI